MRSTVWRKIRIELVEPASGKLAARPPQHFLAAKMPALLGVQLDEHHGNQYWDLLDTPGALGVRNANWMMMIVKIHVVATRLDGDEKRGVGGAPHLGLRPFWHG